MMSLDLPFGNLTSTIRTSFELMEIAENCIATYQKHHPDFKDELWDSFWLVRPFDGMFEPRLYAAHVNELLWRVVNGEDVRYATNAEIIWGISLGSMAVPPSVSCVYLMAKLFDKIYPGVPFREMQNGETVTKSLMDGFGDIHEQDSQELYHYMRKVWGRKDRAKKYERKYAEPETSLQPQLL